MLDVAEAHDQVSEATEFLRAARSTPTLVEEIRTASFSAQGMTMFVPTNAGLDHMMLTGANFVVGDKFVRTHIFSGTLTVEELLKVSTITSWSGDTFSVRSGRDRRRSGVFLSIGNNYSRSFLVTSDAQAGGVSGVSHTIDRPLLPVPTSVDPTGFAGPDGGGDADDINADSADAESHTDLIVVGCIVLVLLMVAICLAFVMIVRPSRNDDSLTLHTPAYSYGVMNTNYGNPSDHGRAPVPRMPLSAAGTNLAYPQYTPQWQDVAASPGEAEDEFDAVAGALRLGHGDATATPPARPGLLPDDYLDLSPENPYTGHSGFSPPQTMPAWTAADNSGSRRPGPPSGTMGNTSRPRDSVSHFYPA